MQKILDTVYNWLTTAGLKIAVGLLVYFVFCKVMNVLFRRLNKVMSKHNVEVTIRRISCAWLRRIAKFIGAVCLLAYLGVETSGIAAAITSVGLTIGLALQGSLANFAGGIILIVLHPYRVGDFVNVAGSEGTVEEIELFYTYLATPDGKQLVIPNSKASAEVIVNYSVKDKRRNDLIFCISYQQDFERAKQIICDQMAACDDILTDPAPMIRIKEHGDSSIKILARYWAPNDKFWDANFYMLEAVKRAFDENGIEIPYPQLDVHLRDVPKQDLSKD